VEEQKLPAPAEYTRIGRSEPQKAEHETESSVQGIVEIATSEVIEMDQMAVLADHSSDGSEVLLSIREGGEVRPERPTAAKEKPGITFNRKELWKSH
jgi:hypothetical protein